MQDAAAFVSSIQGNRWTQEHHCWELVRVTAREVGGVDLPEFRMTEKTTLLQRMRAFRDHPERKRWVQIAQPRHLSVVLMRKPLPCASATHAGIYLDVDGGGVLHVDEPHGVEFVAPFELALRGWDCEFFIKR